jgi:hypothetical protein
MSALADGCRRGLVVLLSALGRAVRIDRLRLIGEWRLAH